MIGVLHLSIAEIVVYVQLSLIIDFSRQAHTPNFVIHTFCYSSTKNE